MYKSVIINGKEFRFNSNALSKIFYKRVFHSELINDMGMLDFKAYLRVNDLMKRAAGEIERKENETETDYRERVAEVALKEATPEDVEKMFGVQEVASRLGFIYTTQTKDFNSYWKTTNFDDYAEWLSTQEKDDIESPEFITAVMDIFTGNAKTHSTEKNQ